MKESIFIYLLLGVIYWSYHRKIIVRTTEDKFPQINPQFTESLMLIILMIGWGPLVLGKIYNWLIYQFVLLMIYYKLKRKLSPEVWQMLKDEMDMRKQEKKKYKDDGSK